MLRLEMPPKFLGREPGVAHDAVHSERVHGILAWNGKDVPAIGHDDVDAFAENPESRVFESGNGRAIAKATELLHLSIPVVTKSKEGNP